MVFTTCAVRFNLHKIFFFKVDYSPHLFHFYHNILIIMPSDLQQVYAKLIHIDLYVLFWIRKSYSMLCICGGYLVIKNSFTDRNKSWKGNKDFQLLIKKLFKFLIFARCGKPKFCEKVKYQMKINFNWICFYIKLDTLPPNQKSAFYYYSHSRCLSFVLTNITKLVFKTKQQSLDSFSLPLSKNINNLGGGIW